MDCLFVNLNGGYMKVRLESVVLVAVLSLIILVSLPEVDIQGGYIFIMGLVLGLMGLGATIVSIWCEIYEAMTEE